MEIKIINYEDVKHITCREYFKGNEMSIDVFNSKYVYDEETPADVFWRVATGLAQFEKDPDHYASVWFSLMWEGWFRPGGSVIAGVGSTKKRSLLNCTTIPLNNDSLEGIIGETELWMAKCAANRQGLGVDLSNLRPDKAIVNNAAEESTGAIPWGAKLSNIGNVVGQRGRMPASLLSLKIHHPDIINFILSKSELGTISNSNISIQITDKFMTAVDNDEEFELYFDLDSSLSNERISSMINARELFELIAKTANDTAEPGVQFIDQMKAGTMSQCVFNVTEDKRFEIISTNACSEKPLSPFNCCNLLSPNMAMFSTDPDIYKDQLETLVPYFVRMSDNVITYEFEMDLVPLPQQKEIMEITREIGLGITNVHGWFINQDIQYDSDEAIKCLGNFFKEYSGTAFKASVDLGKEKGSVLGWDMLEDKEGFMDSLYFKNIVNEFWDGDANSVPAMRNLAHMSVAPTGSLSLIFPNECISSGIEPIIAPYYWRKTRAINKGEWLHYFIIPNEIKKYILMKIELGCDDWNTLNNFTGSVVDEDGKIGKKLINIIKRHSTDNFFRPAHEIDNIQKIKLMASAYEWIDACISCTYNIPESSTTKDVADIYMTAYKEGIRAVSVYREGSREGVMIFEDPITNANRFKSDAICDERPDSICHHCAPKRPEYLDCEIHHASVRGVKWLVIVGIYDGYPYELFAGEYKKEKMWIPTSALNGKIKKLKNGKYSLYVQVNGKETEYDVLSDRLMNEEFKAFTRMLSLSMRHGVHLEFIVSQLKKSEEGITNFSQVVSRVLSKYIKQFKFINNNKEKCPNCGEIGTMIMTGSCNQCADCGFSKCS